MHRKIFAFSIVAVILITSCSPVTDTEPTEEPSPQSTASPTPAPQTYTSLNELLDARVESGAWSEGEGLVAMMQLITGGTRWDEFLSGAEITSQAATGLLLRAQNYLHSGSDEAAKTEIRRLLSAVVPSMEALDLYSAASETGTGRSPGHSTQVDCATFQREGFPADHATECFLRYEAAIAGGGQVNIYFPEGWGDDERQRRYIEATQQAVTDSVAAYDGLGLSHHTLYIFFTLLDYHPSGRPAELYYASADLARSADADANCLVAVYPHGASADGEGGSDAFRQTVAHEIFHCYQFWNYHAAMQSVPYSQNKWWAEGTAEYFGNYVYPTVNAEYEYIRSFRNRSPFESIISMDYENFIFFQYLANEIGNAGVLRLIESMPAAAGASQADALSAFPDIEELFHNFGRAYLDEQIMDKGIGEVPNTPIPAPPRLDGLVFNENYVDAIPEVDRFILQRFKLTFPEERHFELEVGSDGAAGSNGVRLGGPVTWVPFVSTEFDVSCGIREMVLLTTTTSPEGQYHLLLDVTVEEGPVCDECLIGLWELENGSYSAYWYASPAGEAEGVEFGGVTGLMWASYDELGIVRNGWSEFVINYRQAFGGSVPDMDFSIILNGDGQASYTVFGDTLSYSSSVSNYGIVVNMNGSPVGSTGITPETLGGGLAAGPIRYVCTDETLQFISADFPQLNELLFLRAD